MDPVSTRYLSSAGRAPNPVRRRRLPERGDCVPPQAGAQGDDQRLPALNYGNLRVSGGEGDALWVPMPNVCVYTAASISGPVRPECVS